MPTKGFWQDKVEVLITMGSKSDLGVMQHAQKVLDERAARRAERDRQKHEQDNSTAAVAEMSTQNRDVRVSAI